MKTFGASSWIVSVYEIPRMAKFEATLATLDQQAEILSS